MQVIVNVSGTVSLHVYVYATKTPYMVDLW